MKKFAYRLICSLLGLGSLTGLAFGQATKPRIVVGPNILVSREGNQPKMETMVAANPQNPKNLLGASMVFDNPDRFTISQTYVSFDGGQSWQSTPFPEMFGDPQVAFGTDGTAYFTSLALKTSAEGKRGLSLMFFRSKDGGKTWDKGTDLGTTFDHEQLVIDHTGGQFAGRIYLSTLYQQDDKTILSVVTSKDGGDTFNKPIEYYQPPKESPQIALIALNPLILSDGTIFAPFITSAPDQKKSGDSTIQYVTSANGGEKFDAPAKLADQYVGTSDERMKRRRSENFAEWALPMFAVDKSAGKFRDHLYAVWGDFKTGASHLLFSHSSDKGKTWRQPKMLSPDAPAGSQQYQAQICVNNQGILGLMWYDTRDFEKHDQFNAYFTASLDGGETFLPAVRLSSAPSTPTAPGNLTPTWGGMIPMGQTIGLKFTTVFYRAASGGEYLGLTADSEGVFHPFWIDGRGWSYQVMTSRVSLAPGEMPRDESKKIKASLKQKVKLVFDPMQYDPQTQEAIIPVRLQNVSTENLYAPLTVEIKGVADKLEPPEAQDSSNYPQILNATNGQRGGGATFDYTKSLRDLQDLPPGAVTDAVNWRVKAGSRAKTNFFFDIDITGYVLAKPQ